MIGLADSAGDSGKKTLDDVIHQTGTESSHCRADRY
jgi:hypothetical protein